MKVTVVAAGWTREELTLGALRRFREADAILLQTSRMGAAEWLAEENIPFETLDVLFETCEDFDRLSEAMAEAVDEAAREKNVVFVVADLTERAVERLLLRLPGAELVAGVPLGGSLIARAGTDVRVLAASDCESFEPDVSVATLVRAIDTRMLASEVKLKLATAWPEETSLYILGPEGEASRLPLYDLDRMKRYNHRVCALALPVRELTELERYSFSHLNRIMRILRAPDGCPWDREQTHESLRASMLEEAYEAADAIDRADWDALYDELGDVLLQVALHAEIGRECGEFDVSDVTTAICRKMISRHSHIFGEASASTSEDVLALWEQAKKREKKLGTQADAMRAVTKSLPALMRAYKVTKKAMKVHFCAPDALSSLEKVGEETGELREAIKAQSNIEEELGDLLFSIADVAAQLKLDPELALAAAVEKFIVRFERMEQRMLADGRAFSDCSLAEMDEYWNQVKKHANR